MINLFGIKDKDEKMTGQKDNKEAAKPYKPLPDTKIDIITTVLYRNHCCERALMIAASSMHRHIEQLEAIGACAAAEQMRSDLDRVLAATLGR